MSKLEAGHSIDPLYVANSVMLVSDIPEVKELSKPGKKEAKTLSQAVTKSLKKGESVIVNDGSHFVVYEIKPIDNKKIEITKKHRGYPKDEPKVSTKVITNYEFQAAFTQGLKSDELLLTFNGDEGIVYQISSAGEQRPRPFTIYSNNDILLARASEGSLTCVMEYRTPAVWFTNGNAFKNVKQV